MEGWHFAGVAKTLAGDAGVSQHERWFWRSSFVAGAAFGELGRCFERIEHLVLLTVGFF